MMALRTYLGLLLAFLTVSAVSASDVNRYGSAVVSDAPEVLEDAAPQPEVSAKHDFQAMSLQACSTCQEPAICPWYIGAEYRLIRAHFSEAVAFAEVNDSLTGLGFERRVQARELSFDYDSSMRFYVGSRIGDFQDLRFSYWHFNTDVAVNGRAGLGQTMVDPFGNLALTGSRISTRASINLNVYDLEYLQTMNYPCQNVDFVYSAGLRFADVNQDYNSVIRDAGGTLLTSGVFSADFFGVGPYLTLAGSTSRCNRQVSLFAKGGGAVLIGSYEVASEVAIPGVAVGGQSAQRMKAVPILEAELGASWHPGERMTISAGWMFQAWLNIGTSGGTFDGENLPLAPIDTVFGQADDADIMSFDGLFVRAEFRF